MGGAVVGPTVPGLQDRERDRHLTRSIRQNGEAGNVQLSWRYIRIYVTAAKEIQIEGRQGDQRYRHNAEHNDPQIKRLHLRKCTYDILSNGAGQMRPRRVAPSLQSGWNVGAEHLKVEHY